ncbi:MAG: tetratricopeptide repeat protein [Methanomicrobiales archaeon]|jgi:tetratricopeptide (TPR) repeat protein|nr:tetratricopeptide repeat protein [Methanomicrobiales archaeon]
MKKHVHLILTIVFAFGLFVIPVSAEEQVHIKTNKDTVVCGNTFTVTITGTPNYTYYIWVTGSSSMTGRPEDQAPMIMDAQEKVKHDNSYGPYTIGQYHKFGGGAGKTIKDDVPPEPYRGTKYYAQITLSNSGVRTIEFTTSKDTSNKKYTIRVERRFGSKYITDEVDITVEKDGAPIAEATKNPETLNPRDWFEIGQNFVETGQLSDAISAFKNAATMQPDYAEAWFELGVVYAMAEQYTNAISAFENGVVIQPENANAWYNLGNAYFNSKQYTEAISALKNSTTIQPANADAWYNLGTAYARTEQYTDAIIAFENTVAIEPEYALAWNALGDAYFKTEQYTEAISGFENSVALQSDYVVAWKNLGNAYLRTERYIDAINAYKSAIEIQPDYALVWNDLGVAYMRTEQYTDAINAYENATAIQPNYAQAWDNLGLTYERVGIAEKALEAYEMAITIDPENSRYEKHQSDLKAALGE